MAFSWSIEEVEATSQVESSGEVKIETIKVNNVTGWQIEVADKGKTLAIQQGGVVESVKQSKARQLDRLVGSSEREFKQAMILLLIVLFAAGFIAVVISDIIRGNLSFEAYMLVVGSFLSGMGFESVRKKKDIKSG